MGSLVELNDTLQLTREQGFPAELDLAKHLQAPLTAAQFKGRSFSFTAKPKIRNYFQAPVRNFLVENREGKWIYWGLVLVVEVRHDYQANTTSGVFTLEYIYPPEEMKIAHRMIDRRLELDYFSSMNVDPHAE